MPQLFLNNFQTQFIASVKAAPESASPALELDYGVLRVSDGAAGLLLNPGPGNWYVLTAFKRSGSAESDYEVLHVTAVDNAVLGECRLTVLRGQEGTTPKSYVAGDIVELRLTAGGMGQYVQTADARLTNPRAPTGAAGGVLSGSYPNPGFAQAMATAADLGGKVDKIVGKGLSANDYTNADMAKLDGIAEQATKNATDAALRDRASHTGAQAIATVTGLQTALDAKTPGSHVGSGGAAHAAATNAAAGFMSVADKVKLDSVAASATANAPDEALRARASHTGTQSIATIEGLSLALGDKVDVVAGKGLSSADFTAAEKAKLGGIAASATANASDAALRARASHTGTQAIATVTGLQDALDGKQATLVSGVGIKTINGQSIMGGGNIVVSANPDLVKSPANLSPAPGATDVIETPLFNGGPYYSLYGVSMAGSNWQVSAVEDFSTTVIDTSPNNSNTTLTPPGGVLQTSTTYYWRVRYKDVDGEWSAWSVATSFTTTQYFVSYIPTPEPTPAIGAAFQGGFYAGLIWNELTQSSTSVASGVGSKVFTVPNMVGAPIVYLGQNVEVRSRANPNNKMIGTVTDARGPFLTIEVASTTTAGTYSDWSVMACYRVILAPKASGENASILLKNANTSLPTASATLNEGQKSTQAMVDADSAVVYPAAHWCRSLSIGGHTDWYLPSRDELELCYRAFKPTTGSNNVANAKSLSTLDYKVFGALDDKSTVQGINTNSSPVGVAYTTTVPARTTVASFYSGAAEAFVTTAGPSYYYWTSSDFNNVQAWMIVFNADAFGNEFAVAKANPRTVRAVRRSII